MIEKIREKIGCLLILFAFIAIMLVLFSLIAPILFTQGAKFGIEFTPQTGEIGNTIGGIMNPFVALAGVFVTFLAFFIQYLANERLKDEFKKNQIESQFYEMLKFHKENVNDIFIIFKKVVGKETPEFKVTGRNTFQYFVNEIEILYYVEKQQYPDENPDYWIKRAYNIFFNGIDESKTNAENTILKEIQIKTFNEVECEEYFAQNNIRGKAFHYEHFTGCLNKLGLYYRHLYQTVKFIVGQEVLTYSEQRAILKMLRAQLSSQEQIMLFYNWKSGFGLNWEYGDNKYFTDYRMIHNIDNPLLDFDLIEIFGDKPNRVDKSQKNDTYFEFQHNQPK